MTPHVAKDVGERNTCMITNRNVNYIFAIGIRMEVAQNLKVELQQVPAITTSGYLSQHAGISTCTSTVLAALFMTAKIQNHPRYPSTYKLIKKI